MTPDKQLEMKRQLSKERERRQNLEILLMQITFDEFDTPGISEKTIAEIKRLQVELSATPMPYPDITEPSGDDHEFTVQPKLNIYREDCCG